jgi:acetoacetate decarboxylase
MWATLFAVDGAPGRPRGRYAAAFASYEPDSPLTYSELLVARSLGGTRLQVTDIWVDSPASRAGGRELWALPKELADFDLDTNHTGPLSRTEWTARVPTGSVGRRAVATARFTDVSRAGVRLPLRGGTRQPPLAPGGTPLAAAITGSAKVLPGRSHWDFDADGPLGWLRGARQLATFRLCDFRLSFG